MTTLDNVRNFAREKISQYPDLEEQIREFFDLYRTEIEDEAVSSEHEAELFFNSVNELIKNKNH